MLQLCATSMESLKARCALVLKETEALPTDFQQWRVVLLGLKKKGNRKIFSADCEIGYFLVRSIRKLKVSNTF